MEMAGSTLDVSARTQDLKFMASNVNVSNFVSVKLSGPINYKIWKAQMLCIIMSQVLLHIIDAEYPFPVDKGVHMIAQYDQLVKGWIFGSLNEKVLKDLVDLGTAQEVWMKLESFFNPPISDTKEGYSSTALDVIAPADSLIREDLKYIQASTINVSSFVSVKLSGPRNYHIWKAQMICLMESQGLLHILGDEYQFPVNKGVHMIWYYDKLVKGWIFSSMNEIVLKNFTHLYFARDVWRHLEHLYNSPISHTVDDSSNAAEDLKYMLASNVNVSSFVSVKLSGRSNYSRWMVQMICFIESQGLLHIIHPEAPFPEDKGVHLIGYYDRLVKGWIVGSMNEIILHDVTYSESAKELWDELQSRFLNSRRYMQGTSRFIFGIELSPEVQEIDRIRWKRLYEAAVEGCWWKAKSILKIHKNAATEAITANGNTILHLAVEMGQNYFVEKLLEFLKEGKDIESKNYKGRTALHIAALAGNKYAAQLLVKKRKELLLIGDHVEDLPSKLASSKTAILTRLSSSSGSYKISSIRAALTTREYDLAWTMLENCARAAKEDGSLLMALAITFPTSLGFTESFIFPSFNNLRQKTVMRFSSLFHPNVLDKCVDDILRVVNICKNTYCSWLGKKSIILLVPIATLYPIYQLICLLVLALRLPFAMLYFLLWKGLAVIVRPIKNIEKKKKEYQEAKKILSLICYQMGQNNECYSEPLLRAVCQGTYEVVDEVLFRSPDSIGCVDEEGHNVIQSCIINRSEKVYNLIHHIILHTESYRATMDRFENNLAHLAGRLAPSFVLEHTTGAALQLQRELLWREEVEKLMLTTELTENNIYKETPSMVFTREHQDLVKQGEIWMKTTAESCASLLH